MKNPVWQTERAEDEKAIILKLLMRIYAFFLSYFL